MDAGIEACRTRQPKGEKEVYAVFSVLMFAGAIVISIFGVMPNKGLVGIIWAAIAGIYIGLGAHYAYKFFRRERA